MSLFSTFIKDESGATAIEYALIAALVGIGLITALGNFKGNLTKAYDKIGGNIATTTSGY